MATGRMKEIAELEVVEAELIEEDAVDVVDADFVYEGIVPNLDEDIYHAHPALSSTGARQLLRAPAKFLHGLHSPRVHKKEFDVGTAAHSKVLGTGWPIVVIPAELLSDDGGIRTAAARAWVAEQRAAGKVPVKQAVADEVDGMAESVLAHRGARALLEQDGIAEASVFSTDPETGVEVRARFDFLGRGTGQRIGVDLKTLHGDATPHSFARKVADLGYHVQDAHYDATLSFAGEHIDAFAFVCVEKEPPYLTAAFILDDDFREIGRAAAARARHLFARAVTTGDWPGYPDTVQLVKPPMFEVYRHIDETESHA